jgi:hypothetical protein
MNESRMVNAAKEVALGISVCWIYVYSWKTMRRTVVRINRNRNLFPKLSSMPNTKDVCIHTSTIYRVAPYKNLSSLEFLTATFC